MSRYRDDPAALRALVRGDEVHRDVYTDPEVFSIEMERLFANTWVYVGHDSQIPAAGDYYGTTIGAQPVLMVRHDDGVVLIMRGVFAPMAVRSRCRCRTSMKRPGLLAARRRGG